MSLAVNQEDAIDMQFSFDVSRLVFLLLVILCFFFSFSHFFFFASSLVKLCVLFCALFVSCRLECSAASEVCPVCLV